MHNIKTFKTFEEGLSEICDMVPELREIIIDDDCSEDEIKYLTPEKLTSRLLERIMNNFPKITDINYPKTQAISISANEIGYKNNDSISFGWRNLLTTEGTINYSFRISFFNHSRAVVNLEHKLHSIGWNQIKINLKKKSFKSNTNNNTDANKTEGIVKE